MSFQNLFIPHERSAQERDWLDQEIKDQQARYDRIVKAMDESIQNRGFNVDGDQRMKVKLADIPVKPSGPHKVVY